MESIEGNLLFDVVQEVMAAGLAPSVRNIAGYLSPKGRERQIVTALESLVADGRLVKVSAILNFNGDDHSTDLDNYYPSPSSTDKLRDSADR